MTDKKQDDTYRNSSRAISQDMKRIAYELHDAEMFPKAAERLLEMSREIVSHTLTESLPEKGLMSDLTNLMDALGRKFVVVGGIAVNIHGQPRGTDDIDIIVDEMPDQSKTKDPRFMETFGFYRASSSTGTIMTIDHRKFGQIELLVATDSVRRRALETAVQAMVLGTSVPVASPEAMVALKVAAMKSPSRPPRKKDQDTADIISIGLRNDLNLSELGLLLGDNALEIIKLIDTARSTRNSTPEEESET